MSNPNAVRTGFRSWSDGSHITQFWADKTTGEKWQTTPSCGCPSCYRPQCRQTYLADLVSAIYTVAAHYRFSTLLTIPHLSLTQARAAQSSLIKGARKVFKGQVQVLSVIEPHKSGWRNPKAADGFHIHALILHNTKAPKHRTGTLAGNRPFDLRTIKTNSPRFRPAYLFKEYNGPHYLNHINRNGGRTYRASRGFFRVPPTANDKDARRGAAKHYRSRYESLNQLDDLIDDPIAFLEANPTLSGQELLDKARQLYQAAQALTLLASLYNVRLHMGQSPLRVVRVPASQWNATATGVRPPLLE